MTAYCQGTTHRSRTTTFVCSLIGREERAPQQPVPPNYSVDTPDDDPIELPNPGDPGPPMLWPQKKRVPDDEHGPP